MFVCEDVWWSGGKGGGWGGGVKMRFKKKYIKSNRFNMLGKQIFKSG